MTWDFGVTIAVLLLVSVQFLNIATDGFGIGKKKRRDKGAMARALVYYCVGVLSITFVWAAVVKTIGAVNGNAVDLGDVLTFAGAAFGGELLLLLLKRVFAKPSETEDENV